MSGIQFKKVEQIKAHTGLGGAGGEDRYSTFPTLPMNFARLAEIGPIPSSEISLSKSGGNHHPKSLPAPLI